MALYDISKTRSFFSEIAHTEDICYYCEKSIREKRNKQEIDIDEMHKQLKELRGKLAGVRVPKFRYVGHEFTVCPDCLKKVCNEVFPKDNTVTKEKNITEQANETITDDKSTTKGKGKGKNASKEG